MKQKTFLVADTETTGLGNKAIVFDFGYVICTRNKILLERQFLVRETITNPNIMLGALFDEHWRAMFGGKIFSLYIPKIANGDMRVYSWSDVVETLREDMRTHEVKVFSAYNLDFDRRALGTTQHKLREGGRILEYKPQQLCLWQFSCDTVCNTQLYHDVAHMMGKESGWITEKGNVRTTAEKTYAFLSGDFNFVEEHTALADAQIETEILQRLLAKKKTIPYDSIYTAMPWRRAQRVKGRLI
jgi:hypothetical protein